jgi:hypothetical protein
MIKRNDLSIIEVEEILKTVPHIFVGSHKYEINIDWNALTGIINIQIIVKKEER